MPFVRRLLALLGSLGLLAGLAHAQATLLQVTAEKTVYDLTTRETLFTGNARLVNGDTVLTADAIRYNSATDLATATGHVVLSSGRRRLVADEGTYNLATRAVSARNLRVGEFPLYVSGETVTGTLDEMVFTNATVFFRENAGYSPSLKARHLTYAHGRIVRARKVGLGLLSGHFVPIPSVEQELDVDFDFHLSARLGYRGKLGAFSELGVQVPLAPGLKAGADLGFYSSRGVMAGPAASYDIHGATGSYQGVFNSGYIRDGGDRETDILGHPVPHNRAFATWQHQQRIGDHLTLDGEFNYWSDSEVLRDFRHREFTRVQQPDSFFEAAYTAHNYAVSVFTRLHPNQFERVQERLPEVRFDLLPSSLALGVYQRGSASAAVLQADAFGLDPKLRTDRLDAYYGLERTFTPAPWFTFTPVAGGRVTHYTDALGGKDAYTRTFGEVGFDAHLLASGTFDYKNPVWEIDGLRHLVEPKLSYRYAPEAARGRAFIPPIDRRVFSTYLQPLAIADSRNLEDLTRLNTLRLSLNNTLQTRDPSYGSRQLAALNFAADYHFDDVPGRRHLPNVYSELSVTPAPWLQWQVFQRFNPHALTQQEFNTAVELVDQEWWSARLATHFLKNNYEEYFLEYRQRLNEVFDVTALWRYDARSSRFNEQRYGVWQRLGQTWAVKYEIAWFSGTRREGSFALNIDVQLLKF